MSEKTTWENTPNSNTVASTKNKKQWPIPRVMYYTTVMLDTGHCLVYI